MANLWTHGTWTATPGREDDFVRARRELQVQRFRSSQAFREGTGAMEGLLERFEPRTLDELEVDG